MAACASLAARAVTLGSTGKHGQVKGDPYHKIRLSMPPYIPLIDFNLCNLRLMLRESLKPGIDLSGTKAKIITNGGSWQVTSPDSHPRRLPQTAAGARTNLLVVCTIRTIARTGYARQDAAPRHASRIAPEPIRATESGAGWMRPFSSTAAVWWMDKASSTLRDSRPCR